MAMREHKREMIRKGTYDPDIPRAQGGHHNEGYETVY
jgi:hypothetical protein